MQPHNDEWIAFQSICGMIACRQHSAVEGSHTDAGTYATV